MACAGIISFNFCQAGSHLRTADSEKDIEDRAAYKHESGTSLNSELAES